MKYTLTKRGDIYHLTYWIEGKRYRVSTRCARKNEAEEMARMVINRHLKSSFGVNEGSISLSELIEKYLSFIMSKNKTWKTSVLRLKMFLSFIGDKSIAEISPVECQSFIMEVPKQRPDVSRATINRYIATIKHLFSMAVEWEMLSRNPAIKIKLSKETSRMRFYTDEEISRLFDAVKTLAAGDSENDRIFYYIFLTAIYTGMRLGEILNLKWMDIRDDMFVIQKSKSGLKRMVPINSELMKELLELRQRFNVSEYIFPLKRRSSDTITRVWLKVRKLSRITDGRFHDLRHTFASNLIKNGADIVTIKELLGHSDIKMTQVYSHSSQLQKVDAIKRIKPPMIS